MGMRKGLRIYGALICCCLLLTGCGSVGGREPANPENRREAAQGAGNQDAENQSKESQGEENQDTEDRNAENPSHEPGGEETEISEFEFTICFAGRIRQGLRF